MNKIETGKDKKLNDFQLWYIVIAAIFLIIGGFSVMILSGIITGWFIGEVTYKMAKKNKRNLFIGYWIGALFSLIGLFLYWLFFVVKRILYPK